MADPNPNTPDPSSAPNSGAPGTPAAPPANPPPDDDDAPIGNRGITKRFKKFEKSLEKSLEKREEALLAKVGEMFAKAMPAQTAAQPAPAAPGKDGKEPPAKAKDPAAPAPDPLVLDLQKQIEQLKADNAKKDTIAANERQRRRDSALRQQVADSLGRDGIDASRARHAVGFLVDVEKRVRYSADDSDELVFVDGEEELDLSTGLKGWLKSDDGKLYLPPRGVAGSGDRGAGSAPKQPKQQSFQKGDLGRMILNSLNGASDLE